MDRIEKLNEFLAATPGDSFLLHALALEYVKTGDDHKAMEIWNSLLAVEPGYVGSYYHLAKAYERSGRADLALVTYEKGMEASRTAADDHSFRELQRAWEELTGES